MIELSSIDLHTHTTFSDGTDTPEEIYELVKEAGIELFSITDHDAIKAYENFQAAGGNAPQLITGVEFSCRDKDGKYHILGYNFDCSAARIRNLVEDCHAKRITKLQMRLDYLEKVFGIVFSEEEQTRLFGLDNPGKPHIANLMIQLGIVEKKKQAFESYLDRIQCPEEYISPEDAIQGIIDSGGIPILAHPAYGDGHQLIVGEEMNQRLKHLIEYGLKGVEAFYSGYTTMLCEEMLSFAERYCLYVTAGSDYHGKNKSVVIGDTGPKMIREMPNGMKQFLKTIGI